MRFIKRIKEFLREVVYLYNDISTRMDSNVVKNHSTIYYISSIETIKDQD